MFDRLEQIRRSAAHLRARASTKPATATWPDTSRSWSD
jgi:hypothetical protein